MVNVRLQGPVAKYTGYAVGFLDMIRELKKRDEIDFELRSLRNEWPETVGPEIIEMLNTSKNYTNMGVMVGFPPFSQNLGTRYKIIYSMYETDDIPSDWKSPVEHANEVWVPTTFCANVFGKYNPRIRIVKWGVNANTFKPKRKKKHSGYHFGALSVMSKRKGIDVLVSAFNMAFNGNQDIKLTIKTRDTKWLPKIDNPMINVIDEDWPTERLVDFYHEIDCLVHPTRGEGISMSPLQSAMSGTPVLVTNWSGPVDYIDNNGIWGINIAGMSRANNMQAKGALWAEPDIRHLISLMQWAVEEKPVVRGDYSLWTTENMTTEFTRSCELAWRRCHGG